MDSLAAHSRRLAVRDALETIRHRVLPLGLAILTGIAIGAMYPVGGI